MTKSNMQVKLQYYVESACVVRKNTSDSNIKEVWRLVYMKAKNKQLPTDMIVKEFRKFRKFRSAIQ